MHLWPKVFSSIKDIDLEQIRALLSLAKKFKNEYKPGQVLRPELSKYTTCTCILENSTRTVLSFTQASQILGTRHLHFDSNNSSLNKGEDFVETLHTLQALMIDICVIRTPIEGQLSGLEQSEHFPIINAGDGKAEHPTQALLDFFTIQELGHYKPGMTLAIIGDCLHSRVCHSLIKLLPQLGIKILLCGPEEYLPQEVIENIQKTTDLNEALNKADLLYLLRIQYERHQHSNAKSEYPYQINLEKLKTINKLLPVYHPGPCNIGVEISRDILQSKIYFGHQQVHHGVFLRTALLSIMLDHWGNKLAQ